jgi:hypothetical protein
MDGLDAYSRVFSLFPTREGKTPKHPSNPSICPNSSKKKARPEGGPLAPDAQETVFLRVASREGEARPRAVLFQAEFRRWVNGLGARATCPCHPSIHPPEFNMPGKINTLREIAKLYPDRADALDDWQRAFVRDQLQRLERWGQGIRISAKQAAALDKALAAMQAAGAGGEAA